jgi:hypothetical protein
MSPMAIYDELRKVAGSGLKASGVLSFGRYLSNMSDLQQKRTKKGKSYLVRKKPQD